MIDTIYLEKEIASHPRAKSILTRYSSARVILCERYTEIFNRKNQNFRLQKQTPSLILAKKYGNFLHPITCEHTPCKHTMCEHTLGDDKSFSFSPIYNCPFDCQYCFLQGFFRSAHYVIFINFEDFHHEIEQTIEKNKGRRLCFFAGWETDLLALNPLSGYIQEFFSFINNHEDVFFELRTKSCAITPLLSCGPLSNGIIAYSLSPQCIIDTFERKTPSLEARIEALLRLQHHGWNIGLRFDPLFYFENAKDLYLEFFHKVFSSLDVKKVHSATIGALRYPKSTFKNLSKEQIHPLIWAPLKESSDHNFSYSKESREELLEFCYLALLHFLPKDKIFRHTLSS